MPTSEASEEARQKAELRRQFRAARLALPPDTAGVAARRAVHRLWALPWLRGARRLALYLPIRGELDCTPLAVQAWDRGRLVYLPVLAGSGLRFAPFRPDSGFHANRLGIPEPVAPVRDWLPARALDVIVAPLVAFDSDGHRLGMGGGYYDRTLAFRARRDHALRPRFIGIAYESQRAASLPSAAWDVQLDAVVTEASTYRFG